MQRAGATFHLKDRSWTGFIHIASWWFYKYTTLLWGPGHAAPWSRCVRSGESIFLLRSLHCARWIRWLQTNNAWSWCRTTLHNTRSRGLTFSVCRVAKVRTHFFWWESSPRLAEDVDCQRCFYRYLPCSRWDAGCDRRWWSESLSLGQGRAETAAVIPSVARCVTPPYSGITLTAGFSEPSVYVTAIVCHLTIRDVSTFCYGTAHWLACKYGRLLHARFYNMGQWLLE